MTRQIEKFAFSVIFPTKFKSSLVVYTKARFNQVGAASQFSDLSAGFPHLPQHYYMADNSDWSKQYSFSRRKVHLCSVAIQFIPPCLNAQTQMFSHGKGFIVLHWLWRQKRPDCPATVLVPSPFFFFFHSALNLRLKPFFFFFCRFANSVCTRTVTNSMQR